MKLHFAVNVEIDEHVIAREGQRHGLSLEKSRESLAADCECALADALRFRDGVVRVGVTVQTPVP